MYYIDEFLKKNRPKTFMDYAPGEIPKKPTKAQEPLTLGEVAPKTTERVAPRVTTKEESTYTTSNKDLQNIHKNRTNSERHTGRSLRDESNRRTTYVGVGVPDDPHSRTNSQETTQFTVGAIHESPAKATTLRKTPTQTPHPVKLPYRPSLQGPPKMTKLPYIPAQDGAPKMTQYENNSANPYGSPVKIIGDNVTKKDYDDFWNAFREESEGALKSNVENENDVSINTQDAKEFGVESETYKILQDLGKRWETASLEDKEKLHEVAEEVRRLARGGNRVKYAHDEIMDTMHQNAEEAMKVKEMLYNTAGNIYNTPNGRIPPLETVAYLIGMTDHGPWDYKRSDHWRVNEGKDGLYDGKDLRKHNHKNWLPWMYFDGELISADKLGNMNMSYVGKKIGLPEWIYKNFLTTDKDDEPWVQKGIDLAKSGR